jgi:GTP cyclohydrolase IA
MTKSKKLYETIREVISTLGLDVEGENFFETPQRVSQMLFDHIKTPKPVMKVFTLTEREGIIVMRDHRTWGFCPHHLLPVEYTLSIGYLPRGGKALGISKLPRLADWVCSQLPLQEEVAPRVCDEIYHAVEPYGVGCVVRGVHMCTRMRGVKSPCAEAVTDCLKGSFLHESRMREEFFRLGGY